MKLVSSIGASSRPVPPPAAHTHTRGSAPLPPPQRRSAGTRQTLSVPIEEAAAGGTGEPTPGGLGNSRVPAGYARPGSTRL